MGVVAADLDDDGRIDLFVANDSTANYLFRNQGGFRFEEVGHEAGVAANAGGGYQAGMGVACGDLDGDGRLDLAVTNFYGESTTLFHNLGQGLFADQTAAIGLAAPSRHLLGFGVAFLDADNDGRLDLMTANGHISDQRPLFPYAMTPQLFLGEPGRELTDVTAAAGPPFQELYVGRGLAVGDLDNDGRLDAVMVAQNEPLVVFHNRTDAGRGHFVTFRLEGTRSNRDGVGAVVVVRCRRPRPVAARLGGGSYQSAGDPRLHFGLGPSAIERNGRGAVAVGASRPAPRSRGRSRLRAARGAGRGPPHARVRSPACLARPCAITQRQPGGRPSHVCWRNPPRFPDPLSVPIGPAHRPASNPDLPVRIRPRFDPTRPPNVQGMQKSPHPS